MCKHSIMKIETSTWEDFNGEEHTEYYRVEYSTMEDIDTGRMKCTMCGEIDYYTGQWKDFWEKGIPCLGSDKFKRK